MHADVTVVSSSVEGRLLFEDDNGPSGGDCTSHVPPLILLGTSLLDPSLKWPDLGSSRREDKDEICAPAKRWSREGDQCLGRLSFLRSTPPDSIAENGRDSSLGLTLFLATTKRRGGASNQSSEGRRAAGSAR